MSVEVKNICSITINISEKEKHSLEKICLKLSENLTMQMTIESYIQFLIAEELKIEEDFIESLSK